jgi:hypothetical protein
VNLPWSRRGPALSAAALLLLLSSMARAQELGPLELDAPPTDYHSPQHFALEIKFGSYSPNIDATAGLHAGATPFADLWNSQLDPSKQGKRPAGQLLASLELDWQIWHGFGSIGLGGSVGYMSRSTHAFEYIITANANGGLTTTPCSVPTCVRSADTTSLTVIPLALELVYRFDVLALRYNVPLVPYFKGGLAYYLWFIQRGDGGLAFERNNPGNKAIGGVPGFVLHPGVALMLDFIDRTSARTLDAELGINHTYLFFELAYADIRGLGIFANKINLSDTTWNAGLAFEF